MMSRPFCVLLLLSLALQHSVGLKAIVVFGGEEAKGLRANWLDAVKATVSEAKAHHVAETDMTYFFNGNGEEMAALANHGFKVDGSAANVHLNQPTKSIYDAIATQAHADDLLLLLFGHGIYGNGAVDMNGGRSSPASGITPVGGKNILDHIDGTHHTVIVHVSCFGGSAWKDHKAIMTTKHVVAFTMEEKYPADGEKSMEMAKWITPILLCNGVFSSLLGGGSMPRAIENFKSHHGHDATSQDIASFKDVVKMSDVAAEYKKVCKAGYSEYHHPREGLQERQCYVYPDALDFKLKAALPSRHCD